MDTLNPSTRKRKHVLGEGDAYGRFRTSPSDGRGRESGWSKCPLCPPSSQRCYASGRGLSSHIHAVHTPWAPSKTELRYRLKRRNRMKMTLSSNGCRQADDNNSHDDVYRRYLTTFVVVGNSGNEDVDKDITNVVVSEDDDAVAHWGRWVAELVSSASTDVPKGLDRVGRVCPEYANSLPPLLQAASKGSIETMVKILSALSSSSGTPEATSLETSSSTWGKLLADTRDRNGSTAEHWAAGGGHLSCLQWIRKQQHCNEGDHMKQIHEQENKDKSSKNKVFENNITLSDQTENIKQKDDKESNMVGSTEIENLGPNKSKPEMDVSVPTNSISTTISSKNKKKMRRRDGKTPLHYAARNGHLDCIHYLLSKSSSDKSSSTYHDGVEVGVTSGDGTTPLHMACYGGHYDVIVCLVETYGADLQHTNDWGCGPAHWLAMTIQTKTTVITKCCNYLYEKGVAFHVRQSQGHTAVHKAAQKRNLTFLRWAARSLTKAQRLEAGSPDDGGHRPSDVLRMVVTLSQEHDGIDENKDKGKEEYDQVISWMAEEVGW